MKSLMLSFILLCSTSAFASAIKGRQALDVITALMYGGYGVYDSQGSCFLGFDESFDCVSTANNVVCHILGKNLTGPDADRVMKSVCETFYVNANRQGECRGPDGKITLRDVNCELGPNSCGATLVTEGN